MNFYRMSDPLFAASEALRFQILDREMARLSDEGVLGELGEDYMVDSDWEASELPEGSLGYVLVLCREDSMEEVLSKLRMLPVVIYGTLFVQGGEETWKKFVTNSAQTYKSAYVPFVNKPFSLCIPYAGVHC
ncbi:hypothetical protein [Tunturiibacter gelidiferens]|uniref:hypothetical protein n=1 Tax=Tunturiibacter gelidiferens TaxID=3069689 RepID=UPI003D9B51C6